MGAYDDPMYEIGFYQGRLLRSGRLVVDTGIHHYNWSMDVWTPLPSPPPPSSFAPCALVLLCGSIVLPPPRRPPPLSPTCVSLIHI